MSLDHLSTWHYAPWPASWAARKRPSPWSSTHQGAYTVTIHVPLRVTWSKVSSVISNTALLPPMPLCTVPADSTATSAAALSTPRSSSMARPAREPPERPDAVGARPRSMQIARTSSDAAGLLAPQVAGLVWRARGRVLMGCEGGAVRAT